MKTIFKQYLNTDYDIFDDGRCFSHKSNRFLKPQMSVKYPTYNLTYPDGEKRKTKVHRMVAETFLQQLADKNIVNHKDGNTHNFNVTNLEWVTSRENSLHAHNNNLIKIGSQFPNTYKEDLENEVWKTVKDYDQYLVSSEGRIQNKRTKRLLKQYLNNRGYYEVSLWKNNRGKTYQVHQIVFKAFFPEEKLQGFIINHKDGNKVNNQINNLEKVSYKENNLHAEYIIKTHNSAKIVQQYDLKNNFIKEFSSVQEALRQTGINNISRAARTHKTAGGYKWKYKE